MRYLELAVIAMAVVPAAQASFLYKAPVPAQPAPHVSVTGYTLLTEPTVTQIGTGRITVVQGFARNIPLSVAVAGVVPRGWTVYGKAVSWRCPVSWSGPLPWVRALSRLMDQSGDRARIIWARHLVLLRPRPTLVGGNVCQSWASLPHGVRRSGSHPKSRPVLISSPHAGKGSPLGPVPSAAVHAPRVWRAQAGQTVRATLTRWGQRAGIRVLWRSRQDWPVVANTRFTGSFAQAAQSLLAAMVAQGAPVAARLYANHVLVVLTTKAGS